MKKLAKRFAPPTHAQLSLTEAAAAIRENPDAAEIGFMARQLILCTLPHSDPEKLKHHAKCIVCKARLHFKAEGKAADSSGLCVSCNERFKLTEVQPTTNTPTSPVKRPTVEQWTRRSGNLILGITPGRDFENDRSLAIHTALSLGCFCSGSSQKPSRQKAPAFS
jgi:hypothetical protein